MSVISGIHTLMTKLHFWGLIVIGVILPYGCVEECHTPKLINLKHSCLHIYDVLIMSGSILMSLKLSFSSFFVIYVTIYFSCI